MTEELGTSSNVNLVKEGDKVCTGPKKAHTLAVAAYISKLTWMDVHFPNLDVICLV